MGEDKMAFETAAGQVFLEGSDEAMTPFGGFVPLAAFFEKLGLLDSMAARCPAVRTSPSSRCFNELYSVLSVRWKPLQSHQSLTRRPDLMRVVWPEENCRR
jgi:hypothetical protein